jgi:hypothetical protein
MPFKCVCGAGRAVHGSGGVHEVSEVLVQMRVVNPLHWGIIKNLPPANHTHAWSWSEPARNYQCDCGAEMER